jgi:hypothetical protein
MPPEDAPTSMLPHTNAEGLVEEQDEDDEEEGEAGGDDRLLEPPVDLKVKARAGGWPLKHPNGSEEGFV